MFILILLLAVACLQDFGNLEARNICFFGISILLQPGQYDELFGETSGNWADFLKLFTKTGKKEEGEEEQFLQLWIAPDMVPKDPGFDKKRGTNQTVETGYWLVLNTEENGEDSKSFGKLEMMYRWFLMMIGGFAIPMLMLFFTPVLLTFSGTALDFVMNAFALAFIGSMDNGDTQRLRIWKKDGDSWAQPPKSSKDDKASVQPSKDDKASVNNHAYEAPAEEETGFGFEDKTE